MNHPSDHVDDLRRHGENAAHEVSPWVRFLARAGYAAKGVLYCVIGVLAAIAAFGSGGNGQVTGSKGALQQLQDWPFGQVLLVLMAIGLAGYALWRFVQSVFDPEHEGTGKKAIAKRVAWFLIALIHAALVVYVIGLITGSAQGGQQGQGGGAESWTARLMNWPFGIWLVGIAGAAVALFGLYQLYKAYAAKLDDKLALGQIDPDKRTWVVRFSRFGMAARGVVFAVIGTFLVIAAVRTNPDQAKGVGEALRTIQSWPAGWLLLGIVALGLVAYGCYEFIEARYRRIEVH